jgi:hypothetical protein
MTSRRRSVRPRLEPLEGRLVPAGNLTATFNPMTHTLTVVGDAADNAVTVHGDMNDATHFTLVSATDTINGAAMTYDSPTGVKNLVFKMGDGSDSVTLDNGDVIRAQGNVTIDGGDGTNTVVANFLTVVKNLSITNGRNAAGTNVVNLNDLSVGGNVTIRNGFGNSLTGIDRTAAGLSAIGGRLTVTNGVGTDDVFLEDTDVRGNVTINNGDGAAGLAGYTEIFNTYNTIPSVIGGNLTVTYKTGDTTVYDGLFDLEVLGNITLNHGPGRFLTRIDGFTSPVPVVVHGSLSILGSGPNSVQVTVPGAGKLTGLEVGKKFTVATGAGDDVLTLNKLRVGGDTRLILGDGNNTVNIDDSTFAGRFALTTGVGIDTVNIEMTAGTAGPTEFERAAVVALGDGKDFFYATFNGGNTYDANQVMVALGNFVVTSSQDSGLSNQVIFPFGGRILFI